MKNVRGKGFLEKCWFELFAIFECCERSSANWIEGHSHSRLLSIPYLRMMFTIRNLPSLKRCHVNQYHTTGLLEKLAVGIYGQLLVFEIQTDSISAVFLISVPIKSTAQTFPSEKK